MLDERLKVLGDTLLYYSCNIQEGDKVLISGFGTFKVNDRKARKGINPFTKEEIDIPASNAVRFKPSKSLKDAVK